MASGTQTFGGFFSARPGSILLFRVCDYVNVMFQKHSHEGTKTRQRRGMFVKPLYSRRVREIR